VSALLEMAGVEPFKVGELLTGNAEPSLEKKFSRKV
jgi:hypothetical protein